MINTRLDLSANAGQKTNLYDTPLRQLFEEAQEIAQKRHKRHKVELQGRKEQDDGLRQEKTLDLLQEKVKESVRQKIIQSTQAQILAQNTKTQSSVLDESAQSPKAQILNTQNEAQSAQAQNYAQSSQKATSDDLLKNLLASLWKGLKFYKFKFKINFFRYNKQKS